jgi:exosortase
MSSPTPSDRAEAAPPPHRPDATGVAGLVLLGILVLAWIAYMQRGWRMDPDLSHGLVSPVLFLLALLEARSRGTARYLTENRGGLLRLAALLGGALLLLLWAGVLAAALTWSNALVGFILGVALSVLTLAGLVVAAGRSLRVVPFNYPGVVAAAVWALSAPLPPGSYTRLTLALQRLITDGVVGTLHVLGIPARHSGNIIQLATTSVGVEEACSGVRSLVSCLVAAVFFSATLVRRPTGRVLVILAAAPLALGMNFLRSLGLTLAANRGWTVEGTLHDVSGFAVLGLTAASLAGLALLLERRRPADGSVVEGDAPPTSLGPKRMFATGAAAACLIVGAFAWATHPAPRGDRPAPDLYALLPSAPPGWIVETPDDLYRFRATLQTEALAQRTYVRTVGHDVVQLTVYLAYWRPGQAAVSLVASHTPDACWPGAGWRPVVPEGTTRGFDGVARLPPAEYRLFMRGNHEQHVWFWHLHRGEAVRDAAPLAPFRLALRVLRHGFRSGGEQVFIRISSNQSWDRLASEVLLREILSGLEVSLSSASRVP